MTAICTNCTSTFTGVDRDEFGPVIDSTRCAHPDCEAELCEAGCRHLSFACDGCGFRFCSEHKIVLEESPYCLGCAVDVAEAWEPPCKCRQSDAELFDACGCELHDSKSDWNVRRRAITTIEQYDMQVA